MEDKTKIPLTAAEMSSLWTQYINDTLALCVNRYFVENVQDEEVRSVVDYSIKNIDNNLSVMRDLFEKENFPIPIGFTEKDVNPQAPKLFSDTFITVYLKNMSLLVMAASSAALGLATRPDVVAFHENVLKDAVTMQSLIRTILLNQGTYIKPPYITPPDEVNFVEKQHFMAGFFGHKRSVTTIEITHLYLNVQTNAIGRALMIAFSQIAKDKEVKEYLLRGKGIAQKHMDIFSDFLKKEDLPAPMSWDSSVTDVTSPIFSDKLIMFHVTGMIAAGIGNYGLAMAASPRRDIGAKYASLLPEIAHYAEDGANILIKNRWLEEPPQADDRDQLANQH